MNPKRKVVLILGGIVIVGAVIFAAIKTHDFGWLAGGLVFFAIFAITTICIGTENDPSTNDGPDAP